VGSFIRRRPLGGAALVAWLAAAGLGLAPRAAPAVEPADVSVTRRGGTLYLETSAARAEVRLARYRLRFRARQHGTLMTAEDSRGGVFYERDGVTHGLGRVRAVAEIEDGAELTVDTDEGAPATVTLRWLTRRTLEVTVVLPSPETVTAVGNRFRSSQSEQIYGLTERLRDSRPLAEGVIDIPEEDVTPVRCDQGGAAAMRRCLRDAGTLDRRGETVEMYVRPTIALYAPFYHSSRGYGLAVAGTTVGQFDLARSDRRTLAFRFETGTTPASRRLRFHLFFGLTHRQILDEYTALNGRPFKPPDWAFLHWRWRDELPVGGAVLDGTIVNGKVVEDVRMYEMLGIPAGVYLIDRPCARGYRIIVWSSMWACGGGAEDNGTEAAALGYLAPGGAGTPVCDNIFGNNFILDPTSPDVRAWWQDKLAAFAGAYDLDGFKLDRGEEFIPSAVTDVWADGRTGREVRNDYPTLQAQIHHDALRANRPDGDFLVITRAGYTGTPQYAAAWGGDTAGSEGFGAGPGTDRGLRSAIVAVQRAAFMGYPFWGSDTGGYYQFKDREVFARWIEFSAFCPIMEIGGQGTHAPWDMPTEPAYDEELIDIYRRYTTLRETLLPYILAAARRAAEDGSPIVRPLVFQNRWDQYFFGPDLLVAPVWESSQRRRAVYFPSGTWRPFCAGGAGLCSGPRRYRGPATVMVRAGLGEIPVFVGGSAKVP
jgi:alpha-D-xyloside xylohydrolase